MRWRSRSVAYGCSGRGSTSSRGATDRDHGGCRRSRASRSYRDDGSSSGSRAGRD